MRSVGGGMREKERVKWGGGLQETSLAGITPLMCLFTSQLLGFKFFPATENKTIKPLNRQMNALLTVAKCWITVLDAAVKDLKTRIHLGCP